MFTYEVELTDHGEGQDLAAGNRQYLRNPWRNAPYLLILRLSTALRAVTVLEGCVWREVEGRSLRCFVGRSLRTTAGFNGIP
jgi:hypothetical protein